MKFTDDELEIIEETLVERQRELSQFLSYSTAVTQARLKALISRIEFEKIRRRISSSRPPV